MRDDPDQRIYDTSPEDPTESQADEAQIGILWTLERPIASGKQYIWRPFDSFSTEERQAENEFKTHVANSIFHLCNSGSCPTISKVFHCTLRCGSSSWVIACGPRSAWEKTITYSRDLPWIRGSANKIQRIERITKPVTYYMGTTTNARN